MTTDQTQPLTADQLDEIRQRFQSIAHYPGPWDVHWVDGDGNETFDHLRIGYPSDSPLAGLIATVPDYGAELADFLAAARTDVPALVADNARLRAALTRIATYCDLPDCTASEHCASALAREVLSNAATTEATP